jgi:hypothetical protein
LRLHWFDYYGEPTKVIFIQNIVISQKRLCNPSVNWRLIEPFAWNIFILNLISWMPRPPWSPGPLWYIIRFPFQTLLVFVFFCALVQKRWERQKWSLPRNPFGISKKDRLNSWGLDGYRRILRIF